MSKITVLEMNDITKSAHAHNITAILLDLGYEVNLIGVNADKISEPMRSNPNCHKYSIAIQPAKNKVDAIIKKIKREKLLKQTFETCMKDSECVWVASLAGFIPLKKEILRYNNVVRVAELVKKMHMRDRFMGRTVFRRVPIEKEIACAQRVVVPEENRAYIQKVWWNLPEMPMVLPNKPYSMETGVLPDNLKEALEIMKNESKKIILYMGVVGPDRNIEDFARAISESEDYAFYLAGNVLPYARESLKRIQAYGGKYLGVFNRPGHFELIKYAHIGAMPYVPLTNGSDSELNALYCAPNKIFEYAGFGIPMIGSDVIGLKEPFEKWGIGECCSDQVHDILRAIDYVEKNYEQMQKNCQKFYESVDTKAIVQDILASVGVTTGKRKTKILMTVPDLLFAGIQSFAVNLVKKLDSERYQIDFFVYQRFSETYETYLRSIGCNVYHAQKNKSGFKGFIKTSLAFNSFLKSHHYDIVMCHSCQSRGILKGAFGAKINGYPVVIGHAHGMDLFAKTLRGWLRTVLYPVVLRLVTDYRFACSKIVGQTKFGRSFMTSDKCLFVRNAVDLDAFKFAEPAREKWRKILGVQDDTIVIGHVGRFASEKNHGLMVDIFADFLQKHPNALLVFVGGGALVNSIKAKVDDMGLTLKVVFMGFRTDINEILNSFDVFLFPSKTEGLGFALIEAQVNGIPCVASADVIPDEADINAGLITRVSLSASAEEWSECCSEAVKQGRTDPDRCISAAKAMGYDIEAQCDMLDKFFQRIIKR